MRTPLWVGVCIVMATATAHAAVSINMNPDPIPNVAFLGDPQVMNTGTLSASGGSPHVDLDAPSNCTGPVAGTFDEVSVGGSTNNIDLGSNQTVTVKFTPSTTVRGTITCKVNVRDHGGGNPILGHFNITGTAQKHQTLVVTQTVLNMGTPVAPPAATTLFGSVRFNDAAPVHTSAVAFTVQNQGDVDLAISGVAVPAGDYALTGGPATKTLTPNSTQIWTVTFNPAAVSAAANDKTSTLTFTSDDGGTANTMTALNLAGTATTAAISVNDITFNPVAAGSSPALDVTVTNSATAGVTKGTLSVSQGVIAGGSWFTFNGCGNGTTCNYTAPGLQVTTTQVVSVKCSPPAGTPDNTTQTATLTFASDADGTPANVSNLSCTSRQGVLGTNPPSLTYTSQLIGPTHATQQMVTITNTGGTVAHYHYQLTGAQASSFAVATMGSTCGSTGTTNECTLAAINGQLTFIVTYTAAIEGDEGAGLNLVSTDATPYPQMSLSGHGVDKHIVYPLSVQFNDEFRNPGNNVPSQPVQIQNSGEYPLTVSSIQVQGDPQWTLDDGFPFDVPGATTGGPGTRDVMVKFKPNAIGKVDNGLMQVTSNDATRGMISIVLLGNGKERLVKTSPPTVELGDTGAGVPTRLSLVDPTQMLVLTNMDPDNDFMIREIKMQGADMDIDKIFTVQTSNGDSVGGTLLPRTESRTFDVLFTPPTLGNFEANIAIYLDEDTESQTTIPIHGRALFVDAHGGGGCSTGGGSGAGMLLVIGAFAFVRRRRPA